MENVHQAESIRPGRFAPARLGGVNEDGTRQVRTADPFASIVLPTAEG